MVNIKKYGDCVRMWCEVTPYLESVRGNGLLFTSSNGIKFKSVHIPDIEFLDREGIIYLIGDEIRSDDRASIYSSSGRNPKYEYVDIVKSFMEFEEFIKNKTSYE